MIDKKYPKEEWKDFLKNYRYSSYQDYIDIERIEKNILNRDAFPEYFSEENSFEDFNVVYNGNVIVDINLNNLGLNYFKEIFDVKEKCKAEQTKEGVIKCFQELKNFIWKLSGKKK